MSGMAKVELADIACSIARTVGIVGERWTPLILRDLFVGITRFEDLRRDLGIASNVLADRLRTLREHDIVETRVYQDNPTRTEYVLTERGRDLYPVLAMLVAWGDRWLATPDGPPVTVVHRDCGHTTEGVVVCRHCAGPLTAANVTWHPGPGGRPGPGASLVGGYLTPLPEALSRDAE
ncbi:HxlR family transcriptional regulator [Nocardia neocaledoniensis NBRC 108232]|uniref:HxlR family transcriptional regulator n=2 Tax=Nocardia neocaledoniensis TaxID=236511 RepID=A0A317P1C9_9NOCA|nr:HxlR family transcriptional regulator [Nocardia neocaledoniensis]GEM33094.1 HxlR family transcriptional regulator [Nocardia neocaledoniensis NBRC 108232]